jgi:hypothetical protein
MLTYPRERSFGPRKSLARNHLGLRLGHPRLGQLSVVATVGVSEPNAGRRFARDTELPAVCCPVMHAAKGDGVVHLVATTLGAELDVKKVQE